jgi:thioesterase domain-containing protein
MLSAVSDPQRPLYGFSRDTMDIESPEKYLEEFFDMQIPITREMGIRVAAFNGTSLALRAPLGPNVNDKGTAFGGSLYALLVLAGWGLLHLKLKREGLPSDVMIHEIDVTYSLPVTEDWEARCRLPEDDGYSRFLGDLRTRGRGKIRLEVFIMQGDRVAVSFAGSYAAITRTAYESAQSPLRTSPAG